MDISQFLSQVSDLKAKASKSFAQISTIEDVSQFFQDYLGKKSELGDLLKQLKQFSPEEKKQAGPVIQQLKTELNTQFIQKRDDLEFKALNDKLKSDWIDVTKSQPFRNGNLHPISKVQRRIEEIFHGMGFEVADGPHVETEWFNFDALNIPSTHPARDMQDTFFVKTGNEDSHKNSVLRTHTSSVQIRRMIERGAPIRMICPGRTFRNEDVDATHDAQFYQFECLLIDEDINLSHLKGVLERFLSEFFEKEMKIRIRPGYFPFVEPGLEIDIWFEIPGKEGKWLELLGAGMVHPNVLKAGGIDTEKYQGFAFGVGLTRLTMMKYSIDDIRLLASSKSEFLDQF